MELLNLTTEEELNSANQTHLLNEVASMLEIIRAVNQTAARAAAIQELRRVCQMKLCQGWRLAAYSGVLSLSLQAGGVSCPLTAGGPPVQQDSG